MEISDVRLKKKNRENADTKAPESVTLTLEELEFLRPWLMAGKPPCPRCKGIALHSTTCEIGKALKWYEPRA